jgi:hypothetical protein
VFHPAGAAGTVLAGAFVLACTAGAFVLACAAGAATSAVTAAPVTRLATSTSAENSARRGNAPRRR